LLLAALRGQVIEYIVIFLGKIGHNPAGSG
jgi:hypothetical protein